MKPVESDPFSAAFPQRIVCLTEEPTEVLYALGQQHRIVGISGFTVRPRQARREKPKVSAFTSARIQRILDLKPDLVIGFSDIQADIAADLVRAGIEVWISNHRSVAGIRAYILRLGAMVGATETAARYLAEIDAQIASISARSLRLPRRPKVYFEEWDEPMISGIQWVSELIHLAGGVDVFPERAASSLAKGRIIADGAEVIEAAPDIIFGSWCGKRFRPEQVVSRAGWASIPAVRHGDVYEIASPLILQPGPAALTDGLAALHEWIAKVAMSKSS